MKCDNFCHMNVKKRFFGVFSVQCCTTCPNYTSPKDLSAVLRPLQLQSLIQCAYLHGIHPVSHQTYIVCTKFVHQISGRYHVNVCSREPPNCIFLYINRENYMLYHTLCEHLGGKKVNFRPVQVVQFEFMLKHSIYSIQRIMVPFTHIENHT